MAFESSLEIYVESLKLKDQFWIADPDSLLDDIWNYLNDIIGFSFISISYTQSKAHKIVGTEYEGTMFNIKGCTYKGNEYLSDGDINELTDYIKDKLLLINNLNFSTITIRTNLFIV